MKRLIYILTFIFYLCNVFLQIANNCFLQVESSSVYFGNKFTNSVSRTLKGNGGLYLNDDFINNKTPTYVSGTSFFISSINNLLTILGTTSNNLEVRISGASKLGVSVADNFGLLVENTVSLQSIDLHLVAYAQLTNICNILGQKLTQVNKNNLSKIVIPFSYKKVSLLLL